MGTELLRVENLCIERGDRLLISQLDLCLKAGQVLQVAGSNGSGKTSLLRVLTGASCADQGRFFWRGRPISTPSLYSDELLYLGHKPGVRLHLTALENLSWYQQLQTGRTARKTLADMHAALSDIGLEGYEDELCANLSAGQKRRVSLARLRLSKAALWVLDEPFTAIDSEGVKQVCHWIGDFTRRGGAVIYTTHQPVEIEGAEHSRLLLDTSIGEMAGC